MAQDLQLNNMEKVKICGVPCGRPLAKNAVIMKQPWVCVLNPDGRKKAKECCHGSPHGAKGR